MLVLDNVLVCGDQNIELSTTKLGHERPSHSWGTLYIERRQNEQQIEQNINNKTSLLIGQLLHLGYYNLCILQNSLYVVQSLQEMQSREALNGMPVHGKAHTHIIRAN